MYTSREHLLAGTASAEAHDLLTCALQLMMSALTIIDTAEVPSPAGAQLDHAIHTLAEYLVNKPERGLSLLD